MTPIDLRLCRSLLFLPASNPRAIDKARGLEADLVILDLEDSVRPEDKAAARDAAVAAISEGMGRPAAIRVNATGSPWYGEDIVAIRHAKPDFVVLPKAESKKEVHDTQSLATRPILAMIESARGVLAAGHIAETSIGLIVGGNDLSADLGLPATGERTGLIHSLQSVVLAARAHGIAVFDAVFNGLDDREGLERECGEGRAFGFDGKTLIHPNQIDAANRLFGPGDEEVEAAHRLIAAAQGGAERFEGRMIESMHVAQAEAILAKARI